MRFFIAILATCLIVAEAGRRYDTGGVRHRGIHFGGHGGRERERTGSERHQYDWSRNMDRTRGTQGRDWQSRSQVVETWNHRRFGDVRGVPANDANDATEAMTTTEEQPRWGEKEGGYYTNRQRTWADKKRYYQKKYASFRLLPEATAERSDQQQLHNETRQDVEENDRHRHEGRDHHGHHQRHGHDHDRHHHRGPKHHREHDGHRHHGGHDGRRHHGPPHGHHDHHIEHHHGHHDHHRGHKGPRNSSSSEESWSRSWSDESRSGSRSGRHHKHHHCGHKGRWDSSSSEEDWSRSRSNDSSSGSHSRHKGHHRHHDRHHGGHKRHGNSSSSEESWSRSWSDESRSGSRSGRHHKKHHHGGHKGRWDSSSSEEGWSRSWSHESGSHENRRRGKCRKHKEQPSYNVTCVSSSGYEVRRYEAGVWVMTLVNSSSYEMAGRSGIKKLLKYISGHNNGSVKINMTKPVRKWMEVESEGPRNCTRNVMRSVSFFLPREFWDNPPEPLDESVLLKRSEAYDVFAYNFSGYATEHKVKEKHRRVQHILEMNEQPFSEGYFAVQGFDPPWIYYRRHNEILFPVDTEKGTPSCPEDFPNGIRQCGVRECPIYTQVEELSERIFVRQVEAGVYATKKSTTCNISTVMDETYMPLHEYFQGNNVGSISIPRTTPVLQLGVTPGRTNSRCNFTYQTTFYVPGEYQESPPVPNDETIVVRNVEPALYYVIKFSETPTSKIAFEKYSELKTFLDERELCYFRGIFQLAFYDAPWRPRPHLYELSIPVDETCFSEILEEFDVEFFPQDEEGEIRLPFVNDDPNPVLYALG